MSLPIVVLTVFDAAAIEAHLLRLDADARSTRFTGGVVTDAAVRRYAEAIPFGSDLLIGAHDDDGMLVAVAHGCVYEVFGRVRVEAAFSVDAPYRRRGLATTLMAALRGRAKHLGAEAVVAMCMTRNAAMRRVFAHAGMEVDVEGGEVHARCALSR